MFKFANLIIFNFLFIFTLNAGQIEFWNLTPLTTQDIEEETYHAYKAMYISSKDESFQITIQGSGSEKLTSWAKTDNPISLVFGSKLILYVNKLNPKLCFLEYNDTKVTCVLDWQCPESSSILIPPTTPPLSDESILISGQKFIAYAGKILKLKYFPGSLYCNNYGSDLDTVCIQEHILEIDIESDSEDPILFSQNRWSEKVISFSERSYDPINDFQNQFMIMCKDWHEEDSIIVLVHQYYPGYRWIVNTSQGGEAFFCMGNREQRLEKNIWDLQ